MENFSKSFQDSDFPTKQNKTQKMRLFWPVWHKNLLNLEFYYQNLTNTFTQIVVTGSYTYKL